jgi:hypothetical protein
MDTITPLGNFFVGSYITGFLFMLFFIDDIGNEGVKTDIPVRAFAGLVWPLAAIVFFITRLNLFIMGK